MNCPKCGKELKPNAKFCGGCGTKIEVAAPAANVCPNCGNQLKPNAKFCGKCGTKIGAAESAAPVPPAPQAVPSAPAPVNVPDTGTADPASINVVNKYIHWNILPGQVAVKIDETDIAGYGKVKGVHIQDGVRALLFVRGKIVTQLDPGAYKFSDYSVKTKEAPPPPPPPATTPPPEKKSWLGRAWGNTVGFFSNLFGGDRNKRDRIESVGVTVNRPTDDIPPVSIVLVRSTEFPLVFNIGEVATTPLRSEVGLHLLCKISNINAFYTQLMAERKYISYEQVAQAFADSIASRIRSALSGANVENVPSLAEGLLQSMQQTVSGVYPFVTVERVLQLTADSKELANLRKLSEELYVSERELENLVKRNDFLNRLQAVRNEQEILETQAANAQEVAMASLRNPHEAEMARTRNAHELEMGDIQNAQEAAAARQRNAQELEMAGIDNPHEAEMARTRNAHELEMTDIELDKAARDNANALRRNELDNAQEEAATRQDNAHDLAMNQMGNEHDLEKNRQDNDFTLKRDKDDSNFEAAKLEIYKQMELTKDEQAKFDTMLAAERKLREAKSQEDVAAAMFEFEKSGMFREQELVNIRRQIEHENTVKDIQNAHALTMMTMQNDHEIEEQKLDWEILMGNKKLDEEFARRRKLEAFEDESRDREMARQRKENAFADERRDQEEAHADARRQKDDDYADSRREKDAAFSDERRQKDAAFADERRQKDAEFNNAQRRADIDMDHQEQMNQLEALKMAQAIRAERENAEHQREMENERLRMEAEKQRLDAEREAEKDKLDAANEEKRIYAGMSFEQIMAANPNISPEAAQALAKKFEAEAATAQAAAVAAQNDKTAQMAMDQKNEMKDFMQQMMQQQMQMNMQQMQMMRDTSIAQANAAAGMQNAMFAAKEAELQRTRADANASSDRFLSGMQTTVNAMAGAVKGIPQQQSYVQPQPSANAQPPSPAPAPAPAAEAKAAPPVRKCANCGAVLEEGAVFCDECGTAC